MIRNQKELIAPPRLNLSLLNPRRRTRGLYLAFLLVLYLVPSLASDSVEQDWTHYVRIGAYGLKGGDAEEIVAKAQRDGVFGIEVDNDIEGRYESFLDPTAKLKAIKAVAEKRTPPRITPLFTLRARSALLPMRTKRRIPWPKSIRTGCSAKLLASLQFLAVGPRSGSRRAMKTSG